MPANPSPVGEGDVLDGKYRVEKVLGQGGIGVVVAAKHLQLDRRVALKFLLPEILANDEIVARFAREARAAAKLKSEHVTQVLDVGRLASGAPYMVMEYLEGCDLSRLLQMRGRLPVDDAVTYVLQACSAIAEAHAAGIVHRDLKPANLFLTAAVDGSPRIKVLDFGISKSTIAMESLAAISLTSSSAVIGTPLYMSPEQMQSARGVDGRADVWSLGAILYELLAGGPPFMANSLPQLCIAVMQQEPRPLSDVRDEVPLGLSEVVTRCLTKERSARYASVVELAIALEPFVPADQRHLLQRIAATPGASIAPPPADDPATSATLSADAGPRGARTPQGGRAGGTLPLVEGHVASGAAASVLASRAWPWALATTTAVLVVGGLVALLLVRAPSGTGTISSPPPSASAPRERGAADPVVAPAEEQSGAAAAAPPVAPSAGGAPSASRAKPANKPGTPQAMPPTPGDDLLTDRE